MGIAIRRVQDSPAWAVVLVLVWTTVVTLWFASPFFPLQALRNVEVATGGWLSVTLVASAGFGLVQLAVLFGPGRQSAADVGWRMGALLPALVATVLLWALMQVSTVIAAYSSGGPPVPATSWTRGAGVALGPLLAQLLGTALMEETVMRGYLWPQVSQRLQRHLGERSAWIAGLVVSQALFAALHIPGLLHRGSEPAALMGPLLMLLFVGLVFALVYAFTDNLFLAVGAHALGNAPTLLFVPQGPAPTLVMLAGLLVITVLMGWNRRRRRRHDATARATVTRVRTVSIS